MCVWGGGDVWGLTSTKQRIKCLTQGHNTAPQARVKPVIPRGFYCMGKMLGFTSYSLIQLLRPWELDANGPRHNISNNVVCATSKA